MGKKNINVDSSRFFCHTNYVNPYISILAMGNSLKNILISAFVIFAVIPINSSCKRIKAGKLRSTGI